MGRIPFDFKQADIAMLRQFMVQVCACSHVVVGVVAWRRRRRYMLKHVHNAGSACDPSISTENAACGLMCIFYRPCTRRARSSEIALTLACASNEMRAFAGLARGPRAKGGGQMPEKRWERIYALLVRRKGTVTCAAGNGREARELRTPVKSTYAMRTSYSCVYVCLYDCLPRYVCMYVCMYVGM